VAAATRISLKILRRETWRREKLLSLIERFRTGIDELGLELLNSPTPIQPVMLHDDALCYRVGEGLRARGFLVGAIRSPTVPVGSARLRITLCAEHTDDQVDGLVEAIGKTVAEVGKNHSE
jgi:8-amino-7-oxononanoate synthase